MSPRRKTLLIFIWAFILGAVSMYFVDRFLLKTKIQVQKKSFGYNQDPFDQIQKLQQQMMQNFGGIENQDEEEGSLWDLLHSQGINTFSLNAADLKTREDDQFIYYEINIKGLNQKNFSVQVEKGQVVIDGELESSDEKSGPHFQSKFHRSFPIPENVDPDKVQLDNEKEKIIIKFPKMKI